MSKVWDLVKKGLDLDEQPMTAEEYDEIRAENGEVDIEEAKLLYLNELREQKKTPEQRKKEEKEAKTGKIIVAGTIAGVAISGLILKGINTLFHDLTGQYTRRIQMCERSRRSRVSQVICRHVNCLYRGDRTVLGMCPLLRADTNV